jgi:ABC-2 type transport system permease protein
VFAVGLRARQSSRGHRHFWSNVAAVAYKEANVVRHDKALLATVFAQPVMMFFLMGFALSNKPANVPWAVLDQSNTALSRRLLQEIEATGYFVPPRQVWSHAEGERRLQRGDALAFVVIPKDFRRDVERGRPQLQILLDGSDPLQAARVGSYIGQVAAAFDVGPTPDVETRISRVAGTLSTGGLVDARQRFWFNPTLLDRTFFLAALAGMLLTNLCMSATSGGLVAERESGTYEQMLALPTTPIELVLGKLVPYVGLSYAVFLFATIAPGVIFGLWPHGSWLALILVTLPFVLASLAVGVFVSTVARTSAQSVFITVFFILPSFVLSGVMFPYQMMPHGVREIGGLFPLRWYQIALRRIIERGAGITEVAVPLLLLVTLFGVILVAIRWRMKPRLG